MYKVIFKKLFRKKWELLILGMIVIMITLGGKIIAIDHWIDIDWDMSSYSPWSPWLGFAYAVCGSLILYLRKIRAPALWAIFLSGFVYTIIMYWAMYLR